MGEQRPDLDFPGARCAIRLLAFASFKFLAAHGSARAIGADTEDLPGQRVEDRGLSLPPIGHLWSHLLDHALDLSPIDLELGVGQQVHAGGLIAAGQTSRPAHPARHPRRIAVHQAQGVVQGKAARCEHRIIVVGPPKRQPAQER